MQAWQIRDFIASGHRDSRYIEQSIKDTVQELTKNTLRPANSSTDSSRDRRTRSRSSSLSVDPLAAPKQTWPEEWAVDRTELRKAVKLFRQATCDLSFSSSDQVPAISSSSSEHRARIFWQVPGRLRAWRSGSLCSVP